jgi:hypothetical protein
MFFPFFPFSAIWKVVHRNWKSEEEFIKSGKTEKEEKVYIENIKWLILYKIILRNNYEFFNIIL